MDNVWHEDTLLDEVIKSVEYRKDDEEIHFFTESNKKYVIINFGCGMRWLNIIKKCVITLNSVFLVFSIFRNINSFKFNFKLYIRNLHEKLHKKLYLTIL